MKDYQVGQILFLIGETNKVLPIQVVEEVIRTTLHGKEKTYIVLLPDKNHTNVDIKKIKGQIFTDKNSVKTFMLKNANDAIAAMISEASNIADSIFSAPVVSIEDSNVGIPQKDTEELVTPDLLQEKMQPEKEGDIIKVDLGNGKFGKMSINEFEKAGAPQ